MEVSKKQATARKSATQWRSVTQMQGNELRDCAGSGGGDCENSEVDQATRQIFPGALAVNCHLRKPGQTDRPSPGWPSVPVLRQPRACGSKFHR
jgi:hypothetical protein